MFKSSPLATQSSSNMGGSTADRDQDDLDMPFATALVLLERSSTQGVLSPTVAAFLQAHLQQLQRPYDPFPRAEQSKRDVQSGQLVLRSGAAKTKIDSEQQQQALQVAERFEMDEVHSLVALRSFKDGVRDSTAALSDEDWDAMTAYVFEERTAVIGIVAWLLRTQESLDEEHPAHDIVSTLLPDILKPDFASTILDAFVSRCRAQLPEAVRSSASHSLFWTKQLLREQKALLELVFLAFYHPLPADGPATVVLLTAIQQTEWGQRQETFGYFDREAQSLVEEIGDLLNIIAIEALNLEQAMEVDCPIPAPGERALDDSSLCSAKQLRQVDDAVQALVAVDSAKSSPILLGWAFVLSQVTGALVERGVPEAYHDFASSALRVEAPASSSGRSGGTQPLFQLYAAHALAPASALFSTLTALLSSSLLGPQHASADSSDPNAIGYLSVLRGLLASLPLLVRLSFLSTEQFSALVDTFALLYSNPAASELCAQVWQALAPSLTPDDALVDIASPSSIASAAECEILALAQSRFPVSFGPFVRLVRALSAGSAAALQEDDSDNEGELLAARSALSAYRLLARLPVLTHVVPSAPSVTPLPYEVATFPDVVYRAIRPIAVSRSLTVKPGTTGRLVSPQGSRPVFVSWDIEWSAWRLLVDVLEDFAGFGSRAVSKEDDVFAESDGSRRGLPIIWDDEGEKERDIVAALDVFRLVLTSDPSLGRALVEHLEAQSSSSSAQVDLVEISFKLLERALSSNSTSAPTQLVSALVKLIAALLPSYPGSCWTFLRGSTLLFPPASTSGSAAGWQRNRQQNAILQSEKAAGTFPIVLSMLSLVRALVLEEQVASVVVSSELRDIKHGVLERALSWVRDEVWSCYSSWKFVHLTEKYQLAANIVSIYRLVLEEGALSTSAAKGIFGPTATIVIEALLTRKATIAQVAPLLSIIAAGPESIVNMRKATRFAEAQMLEDLVEASLDLFHSLLGIRRRVENASTSLLEKLVLSPSVAEDMGKSTIGGAGRGELLATLARYVVAPVGNNVAVQAANALSSLCLASSTWQPRPPSMIALLGGSEKSETFVTALLAIASDTLAEETLQVAIWDLISSIVDTQAGLAMLLVTGRHYPFVGEAAGAASQDKGKEKEASAQEQGARNLSKSLMPPPSKPLPRTAIGVGLETIGTWTESWEDRPAQLASVLRFFDFAFQHIVEYGTALNDFRSRSQAWDQFVAIAFKSSDVEPEGDDEVRAYCYRMMSKAHAVRVLALDIQLATSRPSGENASSSKAFLKALSAQSQASSVLRVAVETSCSPLLHQGVFDLVHESFPGIDLDTLRIPASAHALDDSRTFGSGHLYSLPLLRRRLDGCLADPQSMVARDDLDDVVVQVGKLNCNLSLVDAQMSNTRSWRQLLEIALLLIRRDAGAAATLTSTAADFVAASIADEERDGQIMLSIQSERLSILLTLVEIIQGVDSIKAKDKLLRQAEELGRIIASPTLRPLETAGRQSRPAFHRTLFHISFFVFRKLGALDREHFSADERAKLSQSAEAILRATLAATRDILVVARGRKDIEVSSDLSLAVSVIAQLVTSPCILSPTMWLVYCQSIDFFRRAFEVFVHMDHLDGRTLYAQHIIDLCLVLASASPRAAEQMALEGLMTAMTNNALTATAEAGNVHVTGPQAMGRTAQHELWTSMLALVVSLVSTLGDSTQFVEQEIIGFVRLYGAQISASMSWTAETPITLPALEEMSATMALMHGLIQRTSAKPIRTSAPAPSVAPAAVVARLFAEQSLHLLQQIVYAVLHPNHLASLIEPTSPEERAWIEKDSSVMETGSSDDLASRPVVARVTLALVQLAKMILDGLLCYTNAFNTLLRDSSEWQIDRALLLPSATVTTHEKASVGTLFDLASYCQDALRTAPSAPSPTPTQNTPALSPLPVYSSTMMQQDLTQILESVCVLCATQLALWLSRDAPATTNASAAERRRATALMRREITGEMAGDLVSMIDKVLGGKSGGSKALFGSPKKGGSGAGAVSQEMLQFVRTFVQDRLVDSS